VLKNVFFLIAIFWTGVILFFCLENAKNIPSIDLPYIDKVIHSVFHFLFTTLWFLYFKKKFKTSKNVIILAVTIFLSFILGIAIELIQQYYTTTRNADIYDVLANSLGAFVAAIVILLMNSYSGLFDKI
jgi:VanZ family protein